MSCEVLHPKKPGTPSRQKFEFLSSKPRSNPDKKTGGLGEKYQVPSRQKGPLLANFEGKFCRGFEPKLAETTVSGRETRETAQKGQPKKNFVIFELVGVKNYLFEALTASSARSSPDKIDPNPPKVVPTKTGGFWSFWTWPTRVFSGVLMVSVPWQEERGNRNFPGTATDKGLLSQEHHFQALPFNQGYPNAAMERHLGTSYNNYGARDEAQVKQEVGGQKNDDFRLRNLNEGVHATG
ncbi:hypothetical protein C8F04DRAFT_1176960 [Mycena alexandri]|uniref:Uncharacterized protein n=1 Tax=Mycena alexandri TaxID=1745969 RepID=A0AAD6XAN3_9AGAR|nr:hypothetical protein C8F04DRAFT_1176960 [Mycena alexandri]